MPPLFYGFRKYLLIKVSIRERGVDLFGNRLCKFAVCVRDSQCGRGVLRCGRLVLVMKSFAPLQSRSNLCSFAPLAASFCLRLIPALAASLFLRLSLRLFFALLLACPSLAPSLAPSLKYFAKDAHRLHRTDCI